MAYFLHCALPKLLWNYAWECRRLKEKYCLLQSQPLGIWIYGVKPALRNETIANTHHPNVLFIQPHSESEEATLRNVGIYTGAEFLKWKVQMFLRLEETVFSGALISWSLSQQLCVLGILKVFSVLCTGGTWGPEPLHAQCWGTRTMCMSSFNVKNWVHHIVFNHTVGLCRWLLNHKCGC